MDVEQYNEMRLKLFTDCLQAAVRGGIEKPIIDALKDKLQRLWLKSLSPFQLRSATTKLQKLWLKGLSPFPRKNRLQGILLKGLSPFPPQTKTL